MISLVSMQDMSTKCVLIVILFLCVTRSSIGEVSTTEKNVINSEFDTSGVSNVFFDSDNAYPLNDYFDYTFSENQDLDSEDTESILKYPLFFVPDKPKRNEIKVNYDYYDYNSLSGGGWESAINAEDLYNSQDIDTNLVKEETFPEDSFTHLVNLLEEGRQTKREDGFREDPNNMDKEVQTNLEKKLNVVIISRETIVFLPRELKEETWREIYANNRGRDIDFPGGFVLVLGPILMAAGLFFLFLLCRIKRRGTIRSQNVKNKNKEEKEPILSTV